MFDVGLLDDENDAKERAKTVHNERLKIIASYANGVAIALLAVGTLSPLVASPASTAPPRIIALQGFLGLICLVGSIVLHYRARAVLRSLR